MVRRADPKLSEIVSRQNGYNLQEGDNTKINALCREMFFLPNIDLQDVNQVNKRIEEFFRLYEKYDLKPGVSALGMALNGHSRKWVLAVVHNDMTLMGGDTSSWVELPDEVADTIKKTHAQLEMSMESNMIAGKINPVPAIFSLKNNFDWKDQVDYKVSAGQFEQVDAESIRKRYAIDAEFEEKNEN